MYKKHFNELLQKHKNDNDNRYYTDVLKTERGLGISIINENLITIYKLPESCSIYTAE